MAKPDLISLLDRTPTSALFPNQQLSQKKDAVTTTALKIASLPVQSLLEGAAVAALPSQDPPLKTGASASSVGNVALSIVQLGLEVDTIYNHKIQEYIAEATRIQNLLEKQTNLMGQLSVGEKEITLSDDVIKLADDLKKNGIEILQKDERTVKPERMTEIKALIVSHSERLKTQLQQICTTKIQIRISEDNSLLESLRMILKFNDRLMSTLTANQRK